MEAFFSQGRLRSILIAIAVIVLTQASSVGAAELTVEHQSGAVSHSLSDERILALPTHSLVTASVWTKEPSQFSGPSLADVLALAAWDRESDVTLVALDDYTITLDAATILTHQPIMATHRDGARLSRRDRGPYWLIFNYDEIDELRNDRGFALSIWQIKTIRLP